MKRIVVFLLPIVASILLSGCLFSGNQSEILTGEDGRVVAGRNQNDGYADGKESDSKALSAMSEAIGKPTVTVENKIDDNGNPVTTTTISLGGLILASKIDQVQSVMAKTSVPKTSFAQGVESFGDAVSKNSTALMGIGLSWLWKDALLGAAALAGGDNRNYIYSDVEGSFNETRTTGSGTATGPAFSGDTITGPEPLPVD